MPPGSVVYVGEETEEEVRITVADYGEEYGEVREMGADEAAAHFRDEETVTWVNVDGVHDPETVRELGEAFGLHPLTMEDVANTEGRPKMDTYEDYLFVVLKVIYFDEGTEELDVDQVSIVLGENFLLSFKEKHGELFAPVLARLESGRGRIRSRGPDYLAYALMDAVVDRYFGVLEQIGEDVEELEEELITDPEVETLRSIHGLKREMIQLRRAVWPLREVVMALEREGPPFVQEETRVYLRDVYDHAVQVIDTSETLREMLSGMVDIYLSSVSNRMNDIMKVLTIIATIFIPLTFIAGVYGMNFRYMPELVHPFGYPAVLLVMVVIAGGLMVYFRRKGWV